MASNQPRSLIVRDYCGSHCIGLDSAETVFREVVAALKSGQFVTLDFSGVETLASSFLNVAVGRLYGSFGEGFVDERLQWTGIDEADNRLIALVIKNAKEHYRQTPAERQKIADAIKQAYEPNR